MAEENKCTCTPCTFCDGNGFVEYLDCFNEVKKDTCPECGGSSLAKTCDYCMPDFNEALEYGLPGWPGGI